mgnify:CR=1 FL=1
MIAEVEQAWFSFREGAITYDDLKEKIAGYYIDFDQKYGDEVFVQWNHKDDQGTVLYQDLEGMSLREIAALRAKPSIGQMDVVSSHVSISRPMDAVRDQQMAFAWREDTVEGRMPNTTLMIFSNRYFFTKVKGQCKIDRIDLRGGGYEVSADEATIERQREYATHPYQDETEYIQTITLK